MRDRAKSYSAILLVLMLLLLLPVKSAYACACCSSPGEWMQRTQSVDDYYFAELDRVMFGPEANTYMTEAGEDTVKGISPVADKYRLSLTKNGRRWTLTFKDEKGNTGTLSFVIPAKMVSFVVDRQDGEESAGGGPLLYHEWRLAGPVTGTGIFRKGATAGTKFHLVLQGTGNSCVDAATLTSWNLQVTGPRADFAFYGAFKQTAAAPVANPASSSLSVETIVPDVLVSLLT